MASFDMVLFKTRIKKAMIRLRGCAGWSAPLLFANLQRYVFSRRGPYNSLDQKDATFVPRLQEVMQFTSLNCSHLVLKETWKCKVTLHLVVVFAFDIPPTAKVIWRWSHSLKSIRQTGEASRLSTTPRRLLAHFASESLLKSCITFAKKV